MTESSRRLCGTGAIWGALGLILCAFAAHGVDHPREALWLRLGGICMLVHAVMVIFIANLVPRSEEHTSELQSLMRISYAVFCLKKKTSKNHINYHKLSNTQTTSNIYSKSKL